MSEQKEQTWGELLSTGRNDLPPLRSVTTDAGAVLTPKMLDRFFAKLSDPELRRRQLEEQAKREEELNRQVKEMWAVHLGKSVDELTSEDMATLYETLFQGWLSYKGITEQEFFDWLG
jgi:hypothetical protein